MKRVLIAGLLVSSVFFSACKTTNGIKRCGSKDDSMSSTVGSYKEDSIQYFNEVIKNKVYFATDRDELTEDAMMTVSSQAAWLQKHRHGATVEGHCDERGTREYNLALGERRANNVKRELVKHGISSNKVKTVSYGKERPEVEGSNDEAYAMNRRAVTIPESYMGE
jgi:peptidoglycan-associated lipoprotein